jgi:hypothetical protein
LLPCAIQGKLRWYVENQELLTKNDQLVREQAALILQLEERLAAAEGEYYSLSRWAGAGVHEGLCHGVRRADVLAEAEGE